MVRTTENVDNSEPYHAAVSYGPYDTATERTSEPRNTASVTTDSTSRAGSEVYTQYSLGSTKLAFFIL